MNNKIIVNADDFGLSESCSKAIAEAISKNLVSSTTAMANGEYISQAYKLAVDNGFVDKVGIHVVLTEGVPLTEGIKGDPFFCEGGVFHGKINRLKIPGKTQFAHLREEVSAQIEKLRDLGFSLTHADSHHHIHTDVFFIRTIEQVLKKYGINKIRLHRNFGHIRFYKKIVKDLFNKRLMSDGFISTEKMGSMEDLENYPGTIKDYLCEIMVHPDYDREGLLIDRVDFAGGFPVGEDLYKLASFIGGMEPVSYRDI